MFTIQGHQFKALEIAQENRFLDRMAEFLFHHFPESREMPRGALSEELRRQLLNAKSYMLETEQAVATYTITAWLLGGDFDQRFPAAREMLSSNVTPQYKQHWLAEWTERIFNTFDGRRD